MCIFCRLLGGQAPASFVHRGDRVSAFLDIQPVAPGHLLVVPHAHAESLAEISGEDLMCMMTVARRLAIALRVADLPCDGVNLFVADGEAAGQEVAHVHLHIIPRCRGDGFGLRFPKDYGTRPPRRELDRLAAELREAVKASDIAP